MTDEPVGYDGEWTTTAGHRTRQRLGYSHERGELNRFVIQLEYRLDEEWATVVRYDHDLDGEMAHDVTEEGLHIDIYRDGEKHATEYITGPIPAGVALDLAEDHLSKNIDGSYGDSKHGTPSNRATQRRSNRGAPSEDPRPTRSGTRSARRRPRGRPRRLSGRTLPRRHSD